jgi:signal transduction histidine kinase
MVRRAGNFFAEAITPIEKTHRNAREANNQLIQLNQALNQRSVDLIASNWQLQQEILQRKLVEESLRKSEQHYSQLLEQSRHMQEQLRLLSRQLLSAQEEERKMISRELHDQIAQTLTGINIRLASLKTESTLNTKGLQKKISSTQRLVEKSVDIVHRFARELRPTVLDDLGLIPALHSFMKSFARRTGVRTSLTAFAAVERLDTAKRTVLFRVAQEALNNVARHAQASRVEVGIQKLPDYICMKIKDDGKSFNVERTLHINGGKRLGLLGMRERLEMVGGKFVVESSPGKGTTILAQIPPDNARAGRAKNPLMKPAKTKP